MGWASGSEVGKPIFEAIHNHVDDVETRKKLYRVVVKALEDADWDLQDECLDIDPVLDKILGNT